MIVAVISDDNGAAEGLTGCDGGRCRLSTLGLAGGSLSSPRLGTWADIIVDCTLVQVVDGVWG